MDDMTATIDTLWQDYGMPFLVSIGTALIILIVGFIVAKWVRSAADKALGRASNIDPTLRPILSSIAYYTVMILVIAAVLTQAGIETTSILAALGAAGLAIGLALQGTLSNIAAGVMLLWLRPLKVGEFIDAGGVAGTIEDIGLFMTRMKRGDGVYLAVPNSQIWNKPIINFNRNPVRRIDLSVGIAYGDDVERALPLLLDLLSGDERILKDPAPQTMVEALADSSVNIKLRCWVNTADFWGVSFDLNRFAKTKLEGAGFSIPFPQQDVHVHQIKDGAA